MNYTQASEIAKLIRETDPSVAVIIVDGSFDKHPTRGDKLIEAIADIVVDVRGGQFTLIKKR